MSLTPTNNQFDCYGVRWQCFIDEAGHYLWRSSCGRFTAWRDGTNGWIAARGGKVGTMRHLTLKMAMLSAQSVRKERVA